MDAGEWIAVIAVALGSGGVTAYFTTWRTNQHHSAEAAKDREHTLAVTRSEHEHQRAMAADERRHRDRSEAYVGLLVYLDEWMQMAATVYPGKEKPLGEVVIPDARLATARIVAFGSDEMRALLHEWQDHARSFMADAVIIRDHEAHHDFPSGYRVNIQQDRDAMNIVLDRIDGRINQELAVGLASDAM
jgi:hypothetical protein